MDRNEIIINLLNSLIDDRINMFGYRETLTYLLDQGIPADLLMDELQFDADDVEEAINEYEEENNK